MYYAPHTYRFRYPSALGMDEFGRPIKGEESEWIEGGDCRCDDNTTQDITDENGRVYRPTYKVVTDNTDVVDGVEVEVFRKEDGSLRGRGVAKRPMRTNYLNYSVFWLE